MLQIKAKIVYNKKVKENFRICALNAPAIAQQALPGQFLSISLDDDELLLRRPFSIHRVKGLNLEILYEVLGKGTESLSRKKSGQRLDIIGPSGNGFDYKTPCLAGRQARHQDTKTQGYGTKTPRHQDTGTPVLVAGGMGVAPLVFLAEKLAVRKPNTEYRTPLVLIGAKTRNHILCEKEFKELGFDVKIATDDDSRGFKGYVSELLEHQLSIMNYRLSTIYACGPKLMLKEVYRVGKKYRLPVQVSLEEHMACGIGACFGCVVDTKEGYKRVCKEGPVFKAQDLVW